jgi:hypothetical protein
MPSASIKSRVEQILGPATQVCIVANKREYYVLNSTLQCQYSHSHENIINTNYHPLHLQTYAYHSLYNALLLHVLILFSFLHIASL